MLLKDALMCLLSASKANQKSEMLKIKGIEIAFEFTNGFASVAQIEKGKGETIERNMELLRPEDLEEDSEAIRQMRYASDVELATLNGHNQSQTRVFASSINRRYFSAESRSELHKQCRPPYTTVT